MVGKARTEDEGEISSDTNRLVCIMVESYIKMVTLVLLSNDYVVITRCRDSDLSNSS